MKATYQTRIETDSATADALSAYARLYGHVERRLFAAGAAGEPFTALKRGYLVQHGISSRLFNSVKVALEGKVKAVQATRKVRIDDLKRRLAKAEKTLAKLEKKGLWIQVHRKGRRLETLRHRLRVLELDRRAGLIRLCFGSRRLWRKQYDLEANGYVSHEEWLEDWRDARSDAFFVLGSRDEASGCQLCRARIAEDGSLTLTLRKPDCLADRHGKYVTISGVRFAYGHEQVMAALASNAEYAACRRERGEKPARATDLGQAISYRFKRDAKGWRVFVTTETQDVPVVTDRKRGAIGVDLNADHLAACETDASGNYVHAFRVPLVTYGKSRHQAEALIGDAVARVVEHARRVGKPIVLERLDFRRKKAALEGESRKCARMLSSLSYAKTLACFLSRGHRQGVGIHQVNPAFSSVIGRVKFMERYGLSIQQAAALVLARRLLGCSERIPRRWVAPVGNGVHVAFRVPVRKRAKHVWTYWGAVLGQLRPALAAQNRLGKCSPEPVEGRPQSNPGVRAGSSPRGWPGWGSVRCSRVRVPGGAVLHSWGGGAVKGRCS